MSTVIDNVDFFNRLTHSDDGLVELKVVQNLLNDFQKYFIIKNIVTDNENIKSVTLMEDDKSHLIFKIKFDKKDYKNKFIEIYKDDTIEHKNNVYRIIIKEKDSCILLRLKGSE